MDLQFGDNTALAGEQPTRMQNTTRELHVNGQRPVQFGQRPHNASANRTPGNRAQPLAAFDPDPDQAAIGPTSAARLAAEAAFTAPQVFPPPTSQAQITVRRARLGILAKQPAADSSTPVTKATAEGPRVFRVDSARSAAAAMQLQRLQETTPADGSAAAKKTRRHRVAADKRPGPVSHMVHAAFLQREAEPAEPRVESLIAELASVTPILESIQRAQSFWFIDDRFAQEWQRLSQQADEIRKEIQAQLR